MKDISLTVIMVMFFSIFGISQDSSANSQWKLYPSSTDSVSVTDTIFGLKKSVKPGIVTVKKDQRIDKVSNDLAGGNSKKPLIKGYRVQVISSSTKANVDVERANYMAYKTYIDYKAPNFRLRVGNFRTRLDAERFQNEIKVISPNTLIISDMIELPLIEE
jgi:hypothetical protein